MEYEEFKEEFLQKAKLIQINVNEEQVRKLYKYMQLLLEWNEKINLTAIIDAHEIITKHFIDSLTILQYISKQSYLVDVGTGAGFPGIPVKIIRPDVKILLVDSLQKRISFLNELINELDLNSITSVHARAEEIGKNEKYREKFDFATSRAVANLSVLSEFLLPMLKIGGKAICMKGANVEKEKEDAENAVRVLGGKVSKVDTFLLPETDMGRNIIIIDKVQITPKQYPRKAGIPAKQQIQ